AGGFSTTTRGTARGVGARCRRAATAPRPPGIARGARRRPPRRRRQPRRRRHPKPCAGSIGHSDGGTLHRSAAGAQPTARKADPTPFVGEANPAYGQPVRPPRDRLADDPVPPDVAYQLIHDELLLDGSSRLNLATFVTTWMEPQARALMAECVDKNMI